MNERKGIVTTEKQIVTDALDLVETLRKENRAHQDEPSELRPLARLAKLLSLQEGENSRQHLELRQWDRDWEDVKAQYLKLKVRVEKLETQMTIRKPSAGRGDRRPKKSVV